MDYSAILSSIRDQNRVIEDLLSSVKELENKGSSKHQYLVCWFHDITSSSKQLVKQSEKQQSVHDPLCKRNQFLITSKCGDLSICSPQSRCLDLEIIF